MDVLAFFAQLIAANLYPMAMFLALLSWFTVKKKEALLVALIMLFLLLPAIKDFYAVPRLCAGIAGCPVDFAFPSGHATVAFLFAAASIGLPASFFFLPFAVFVGWSRLFLGVHTLDQVVGGAALAFVAFFLAEWLVARFNERFGIKRWFRAIPGGVGA